jgi:hypothetical protein
VRAPAASPPSQRYRGCTTPAEETMKGAEKPKRGQKKQPQKSLKERRAEKRAAQAKKPNSM